VEEGLKPLRGWEVRHQVEGLGEGYGPPLKGLWVKARGPGEEGLQDGRPLRLQAGEEIVKGLGQVKDGLPTLLGQEAEQAGLHGLAVDPGKVQEVDHFPSLPGGDYPWLPAFSRGITLRSALANIPRYIAEVLALQRVGRLKGRFVFSHRLPLAEAAEGYRLFHERKAAKVALVP
jgi:hypothetical protein